MDTVSFQNPGLIDPKAIVTFGANVKESDNPIGFFGTGLKYAIAILLRKGHNIVIYRGLEPFTFGISNADIRGKEHPIVTMNGEELGFTTHMGKNWEMWQAFREIHCNSMDEGGVTRAGILQPVAGKTTIHVTGEEFHSCLTRMDEIILPDLDEFDCTMWAQVYKKPSFSLYYRKVNVGKLESLSLFTYNIVPEIDLTEDRTAKYDFEWKANLRRHIQASKNLEFLRAVLVAPQGSFESHIRYEGLPGPMFLKAVGELRKTRGADLNPTALDLYFKHNPVEPTRHAELDEIEQEQMANAKAFCKAMGFPADDYPIVIVDALGFGIHGQAKNGEILISKLCFARGTKYLASVLIEEFVHLRHGLRDETRELQTFLFDHIVSMGERHVWHKPL